MSAQGHQGRDCDATQLALRLVRLNALNVLRPSLREPEAEVHVITDIAPLHGRIARSLASIRVPHDPTARQALHFHLRVVVARPKSWRSAQSRKNGFRPAALHEIHPFNDKQPRKELPGPAYGCRPIPRVSSSFQSAPSMAALRRSA